MSKVAFTVSSAEGNHRLDAVLAGHAEQLSRSAGQKLIKGGLVRVNGVAVTSPRYEVKPGDAVAADYPDAPAEEELTASEFDYPILYEDEAMLVIDKPAGVVVHPGAGNSEETVVNALLGRYPDWQERFMIAGTAPERPGIVHRLDKDTSGCLIIAKTPEAHLNLSRSFADRLSRKLYRAILLGIPDPLTGEIKNQIGRHPVNRQKMAVVERNGKIAHSRYRVTMTGELGRIKVSLAEVRIYTGRTHQIRVHMSSIGHPVWGDELYGGTRIKDPAVTRQLLHASVLQIPHPFTGKMCRFHAPLPEDFLEVMEKTNMEEMLPEYELYDDDGEDYENNYFVE